MDLINASVYEKNKNNTVKKKLKSNDTIMKYFVKIQQHC